MRCIIVEVDLSTRNMRISPKKMIKGEGQDASKIGQTMILNDEFKILLQTGFLHQLPQ